MKKTIPLWMASLVSVVLCLSGWVCGLFSQTGDGGNDGNFTQDMKFTTARSLHGHGSDELDRLYDNKGSRYFYSLDLYNLKSTSTRFILSHFKTMDQTSEWSCGQSCMLMVLERYGMRNDWDEEKLAALREDHCDKHPGTCLDQMIASLKTASDNQLELVTTYDFTDRMDEVNLKFFLEQVKSGFPIIIGWNDWGGHWEVVIGYDTMGTDSEEDDVLIVADPYDTTDHNQDGYGVLSASRFIENFSFYSFFPDDHQNEKCFLVVKPAK